MLPNEETPIETSIRARLDCPQGGQVVTMGFPGLVLDGVGGSYIDPNHLAQTLDHEAMAAGEVLLVLVEKVEVPEGAIRLLAEAARARGIEFCHLPIPDYQAPGKPFEEGWNDVSALIDAVLERGATVGISCHHGAGRSGMIAASLLIAGGMTKDQAVETIRAQFEESIESDVQMAWLAQQAG